MAFPLSADSYPQLELSECFGLRALLPGRLAAYNPAHLAVEDAAGRQLDRLTMLKAATLEVELAVVREFNNIERPPPPPLHRK